MIFSMPVEKQIKLSKIVEDKEPLARIIFYKRHFSKENGRIKRQAFMPAKDKKVSVIRHKGCPKDCYLRIAERIEEIRGKNLEAIGSISTEDVRVINNLDVESDTSGGQHRRHANIKNFNNYNDAKIKKLAQELARKASLLYVV